MGNDYNLWSKGVPKTNESPSTSKTTTISTERSSKQTKDVGRNPTTTQPTTSMDLTQKILGDLNLHYDVVEDLKKMNANIIVFELCKITQLREQLRETLQHIQILQDVVVRNIKATLKWKNTKATKSFEMTSVISTSSVKNKEKTTTDKKQYDPKVDGVQIGRKSRSQTSPFLLTFDIFNRNVHNCLVHSGDSSNVMPYSICKNLNAEP